MEINDQWIGAYYPNDLIHNQRSKAIMCLLFDKVLLHFPFAYTGCGGGAGASNILLSESLLAEAEILEAREELLLDSVEYNFSPGYFWGTDEEFQDFYKLQVTAMTMLASETEGAVPVTDNSNYPVPLNFINKVDLYRSARLHAAVMAIQCLEIALPSLAEIHDEDILKAREILSEQLIPFRRAMISLCPTIRDGIDHGATLNDIYNEAKYIVDTRISIALHDLRERLRKEKGKFWGRLLLKGGAAIPKLVVNWATQGWISASVDAINSAKNLTIEFLDRKDIVDSMKKYGGLGYLLSISDYPFQK